MLGLLSEAHLLVAQRLDIVGVGRTTLVTFLLRTPGLQFHGATLVGDQCRSGPVIIGLPGDQVPAQHCKLAGNGDGSNLMTPPRPNTHEEGVQRPGCLGRRPSGLDQHGAGVAAADLADAAMVGGAETRLAHARVQSEIAHQLLRAGEAADVADRRHQPGGYREIDGRLS